MAQSACATLRGPCSIIATVSGIRQPLGTTPRFQVVLDLRQTLY